MRPQLFSLFLLPLLMGAPCDNNGNGNGPGPGADGGFDCPGNDRADEHRPESPGRAGDNPNSAPGQLPEGGCSGGERYEPEECGFTIRGIDGQDYEVPAAPYFSGRSPSTPPGRAGKHQFVELEAYAPCGDIAVETLPVELHYTDVENTGWRIEFLEGLQQRAFILDPGDEARVLAFGNAPEVLENSVKFYFAFYEPYVIPYESVFGSIVIDTTGAAPGDEVTLQIFGEERFMICYGTESPEQYPFQTDVSEVGPFFSPTFVYD